MAESKTLSLKKEIRRQIRTLRAELLKPESIGRKDIMDRKIREQVLTLLNRLRMEENIPDTVYLYASFGGEADTFGLMDALWQQGLSVALPRVADGFLSGTWPGRFDSGLSGYSGTGRILRESRLPAGRGDHAGNGLYPGRQTHGIRQRLLRPFFLGGAGA